MSTVYRAPKINGVDTSFVNYYSSNPNADYSVYQDESQNDSIGLYNRTALGKMIIDAVTRQTIGKGLTPMAAPETALLDWNEETVTRFRQQAEAFWRLVTNDVNFDWYGKNNFKQLQQIGFKNILVAGDTLRHPGYRKLRNGTVVPYLQLISGRMVTQNNEPDTENSIGGVLIDPITGKETGYLLRVIDESLEDSLAVKPVSRYNPVTKKLQYDLIALQKSDPSLVRGIPFLTALRGSILGIGKYQDNHLLQSTVQNIFTAFLESQQENPNGVPLSKKLVSAGAKKDPVDDRLDLGSGLIVRLDPGEHVNMVQSNVQGLDYAAYLKMNIGIVASACGLSYETVMNSFTASYSASRAGISGAEKNNAILREEFVTKFCEPEWAHIIDFGVLSGMIDAPGYFDHPMKRKAILATTWTGVTPTQVDPVKDVNAYLAAIKGGICTHEKAARDLYGLDFGETLMTLASEYNAMRDAGIPVEEKTNTQEQDADEDTENEQEEEEEEKDEE